MSKGKGTVAIDATPCTLCMRAIHSKDVEANNLK